MNKKEINNLYGPPGLIHLAENLRWQESECGIKRFQGIHFGEEFNKRSAIFKEALADCKKSVDCEVTVQEQKLNGQVREMVILGRIRSQCFASLCEATKVMLGGHTLRKTTDGNQSSYSVLIRPISI